MYATAQHIEALLLLSIVLHIRFKAGTGLSYPLESQLFAYSSTLSLSESFLCLRVLSWCFTFSGASPSLWYSGLWLLAPTPKTVFTEFRNNADAGLSYLVGLLGPVVTLIDSDSVSHLSEELKDAAWVLPRSVVATALINYSLGFLMIITFMSTIRKYRQRSCGSDGLARSSSMQRTRTWRQPC